MPVVAYGTPSFTPPPPPPTGLLATSNSDGSVSIIDASTLTVSANVVVGTSGTALGLEFSHGGTLIAVAVGSGTLEVIDVSLATVVHTVAVGTTPYDVAWSPDDSKIAVACRGSGDVYIVDTSTWGVVTSYSAGAGPQGAAYSPYGNAVATSDRSGTQAFVSTSSGWIVEHTVSVGNEPNAIAWSPDGTFIVTSNYQDGTVTAVDAFSFDVIATVTVADTTIANPYGLAVSQDSSTLIVSNSHSAIAVVDTGSWSVVSTPSTVAGSFDVTYTQDGGNIALVDGSTLYVADAVAFSVTGSLAIANGPYYVAANLSASTPPPAGGGPPHGFSLALTANPMTANPHWTRVDSLPGVLIESIEIDRGRPTEWDKTSPGICTIRGTDKNGVLDPTNPSSPLYPHLVPVKQGAVTLYNPDAGEWKWAFRGHISYIENAPDASENWQTFEIQLVDMLDILNDAEVVPDFAGNRVPTESLGDTFYTGQHVDDRILAVLADASTAFMRRVWPVSMLQIASGNVNVQGTVYSRGTPLLRVIDEACDAEFPDATNRFVTVDGQFAFRGRGYRYNPLNYIPLSDRNRHSGRRMLHWFVGDMGAFQSGLESGNIAVPTAVTYRVDKADLINAVLVTAKGVTDATLAGGTLFSSDAASVRQYGVRTGGRSIENLIVGDAGDGNNPDQEAASYADAICQNYKDPITYVNKMTFKTPVDDGTTRYSNVWRILTEVELSDLVTYYDTHPGGGGFTVDSGQEHDHFVESIKYVITALRGDEAMIELTLGLSSRGHYRYLNPTWGINPKFAGGALSADFSAVTDKLYVMFYDLSSPGPSGAIQAWAWDFGDGVTSTDEFPVHTYSAAGTYSVMLTVTGHTPDGTATVTIPVTVSS